MRNKNDNEDNGKFCLYYLLENKMISVNKFKTYLDIIFDQEIIHKVI